MGDILIKKLECHSPIMFHAFSNIQHPFMHHILSRDPFPCAIQSHHQITHC